MPDRLTVILPPVLSDEVRIVEALELCRGSLTEGDGNGNGCGNGYGVAPGDGWTDGDDGEYYGDGDGDGESSPDV